MTYVSIDMRVANRYNIRMKTPRKNISNPWPRMALASVLTVWSGANLWSFVFRFQDIMDGDFANRTLGLVLGILFSLLPLVVAIYLFWTIVVGPEEQLAKGKVEKKSKAGETKKSQSVNKQASSDTRSAAPPRKRKKRKKK